jgi:RNA polymerase sigma-70 factor (ECF subfamily)
MDLPPTHWTLLSQSDDADGRIIEHLYRTYQRPVMMYLLSRWQLELRDAEDCCHDFFLKVIREKLWARADPARGRFRTFVFVCLRNFVCGRLPKPAAEPGPPDEGGAPNHRFDRDWALALLRASLAAVEKSWALRGRAREYTILQSFLPGASQQQIKSDEAAAELGVSNEAFRQELSRLRAAVRKELRRLVSETVDPMDVDDEVHYLFEVLNDGDSGI